MLCAVGASALDRTRAAELRQSSPTLADAMIESRGAILCAVHMSQIGKLRPVACFHGLSVAGKSGRCMATDVPSQFPA
jgi:hypothetical protein